MTDHPSGTPSGTTSLELSPGAVVRIPAGVPRVVRPLGDAPRWCTSC